MLQFNYPPPFSRGRLVSALFLSALACTAAQAATITVDSDVDARNQTGICTLRDAVLSVNAGSDQGGCVADITLNGYGTNDTIEFSLPAGTVIPVTTPLGLITITPAAAGDGSLTINAPDGITLDGNDTNRIFYVTGGTSLSITGVTFRNGNAGSANGGAIHVSSSGLRLTLEQCAFEDNQANNGGAVYAGATTTTTIRNSTFNNNEANNYGGAVYAGATTTIRNSTFTGNEANNYDGGAVRADTATISNSTFSGNEAGDWGGAVKADTATISNSTFSSNSANNNGGAVYASSSLDARHLTLLNNTAGTNGQALYVYDSSGTATLHNSIIIGSNNGSQCTGAAGVTFTGSYNLEGWANLSGWQGDDNSCGGNIAAMPSTGDDLADIIDSALDDNGGLTPTLKLPQGSPAIGAADTTGTSQMWDFTANAWADATEDQRGVARRPAADGHDIGAYASVGLTPTALPNGTVNQPYPSAQAQTLLVTATSGGKAPYSYSNATALPAGLSLSSNGAITGAPTGSAGSFSFDVTVTDDDGVSVTKAFTIDIEPRALPTGSAPIPVLPVPLLLGLAAALGLLGRKRLTQRA